MKLIDLLVQEWPEVTSWPSGVFRVEQYSNGYIFDNDREKKPVCYFDCVADDWNSAVVNKDQYEAALAASQQQAWPGEGLPPVGCDCEWQDRNTKQWIKVSVVYASEWVTVIREDKIADPVELAIENYGDEARRQFRPIRTEAELKRDEFAKQLADKSVMGEHWQMQCVGLAVYDAIASGKIPGVKLE